MCQNTNNTKAIKENIPCRRGLIRFKIFFNFLEKVAGNKRVKGKGRPNL